MDDIARRWTVSTAKKNVWRTIKTHDIDDLLQEAAIIHLKISKKYPLANAKQCMKLYQRAFENRIHDITRRIRTQQNITDAVTEHAQTEMIHPDTSVDLVMMPTPLKKALVALATDPRALVTFLWTNGGWETANQKLCRTAGIGEDETPLMEQVKAYLQEAGFAGAYG